MGVDGLDGQGLDGSGVDDGADDRDPGAAVDAELSAVGDVDAGDGVVGGVQFAAVQPDLRALPLCRGVPGSGLDRASTHDVVPSAGVAERAGVLAGVLVGALVRCAGLEVQTVPGWLKGGAGQAGLDAAGIQLAPDENAVTSSSLC